jgi:multicomponent Na+:H+ antiporter subunit G
LGLHAQRRIFSACRRVPDFWSRLHAVSIIDSAGAGLILLGLMLQAGLTLIMVKLVIIVIFLLITGPTASHAVANAAFVSGSRPRNMVEDVTEETSTTPEAKA